MNCIYFDVNFLVYGFRVLNVIENFLPLLKKPISFAENLKNSYFKGL